MQWHETCSQAMGTLCVPSIDHDEQIGLFEDVVLTAGSEGYE